jgi:hypothetical protein
LVEQLICNQQVVGSNPTAGYLYYQALTLILAAQGKSVFAICLPLLRRKVSQTRTVSRAGFFACSAMADSLEH